ncbi:MAG: hypothetical protein Solumvirus6_6 [Solumvirus sp.]|uniref:Uncharacterized protein n=1 Tax=Solumvirus sp. TaxID=2487773 RepID=A0A3G5AJ82_9VIRU|nr:MAG: hypothetical protein Solumvirus6_6 [Solumvirus sp.]
MQNQSFLATQAYNAPVSGKAAMTVGQYLAQNGVNASPFATATVPVVGTRVASPRNVVDYKANMMAANAGNINFNSNNSNNGMMSNNNYGGNTSMMANNNASNNNYNGMNANNNNYNAGSKGVGANIKHLAMNFKAGKSKKWLKGFKCGVQAGYFKAGFCAGQRAAGVPESQHPHEKLHMMLEAFKTNANPEWLAGFETGKTFAKTKIELLHQKLEGKVMGMMSPRAKSPRAMMAARPLSPRAMSPRAAMLNAANY